MVKQLAKERRRGVRAKRVLSIQYRLYKSKAKGTGERTWNLSTTQDMSIVGLSFLSDRNFVPGDILEAKVVMAGVLDIYKGYVRVVRTEKKESAAYYFVGVSYTKLKGKSRKAKNYSSKSKSRIKKY